MARDCPNAPAEDGANAKPRSTYIPPPEPEDEEHIFSTILQGINFSKYDQIKVMCTGVDALKEQDTVPRSVILVLYAIVSTFVAYGSSRVFSDMKYNGWLVLGYQGMPERPYDLSCGLGH